MSHPSGSDPAPGSRTGSRGDADPDEFVVLVDEGGSPVGSAGKSVIHTGSTPLHLAFSCHVLHAGGQVLVTRRALTKRTFPGVWTNSFCGHPGPGEDIEDAVRRRGERELGLAIGELELVLPDFRYEAADASGVVENEICPVYRTVVETDPRPAADEVAEWRWVDPAELRAAVTAAPFAFSPWLVLQLRDWDAFGR